MPKPLSVTLITCGLHSLCSEQCVLMTSGCTCSLLLIYRLASTSAHVQTQHPLVMEAAMKQLVQRTAHATFEQLGYAQEVCTLVQGLTDQARRSYLTTASKENAIFGMLQRCDNLLTSLCLGGTSTVNSMPWPTLQEGVCSCHCVSSCHLHLPVICCVGRWLSSEFEFDALTAQFVLTETCVKAHSCLKREHLTATTAPMLPGHRGLLTVNMTLRCKAAPMKAAA